MHILFCSDLSYSKMCVSLLTMMSWCVINYQQLNCIFGSLKVVLKQCNFIWICSFLKMYFVNKGNVKFQQLKMSQTICTFFSSIKEVLRWLATKDNTLISCILKNRGHSFWLRCGQRGWDVWPQPAGQQRHSQTFRSFAEVWKHFQVFRCFFCGHRLPRSPLLFFFLPVCEQQHISLLSLGRWTETIGSLSDRLKMSLSRNFTLNFPQISWGGELARSIKEEPLLSSCELPCDQVGLPGNSKRTWRPWLINSPTLKRSLLLDVCVTDQLCCPSRTFTSNKQNRTQPPRFIKSSSFSLPVNNLINKLEHALE